MAISLSLFSRDSSVEPAYERFIDSYVLLRFLIGLASFLLPLSVMLWGFYLDEQPWFHEQRFVVADSLSAYYYTPARNVFIGVLWAVGAFLIAYIGENRKQNLLGWIGGASAIVVASVPTLGPTDSGSAAATDDVGPYIHAIAAGTFFFVMALFSIFVFTRRPGYPSRITRTRDVVHYIIGITIIAGLVAIVLTGFEVIELPVDTGLFWIETGALLLVGISWMLEFIELFPGWFKGRVDRMLSE